MWQLSLQLINQNKRNKPLTVSIILPIANNVVVNSKIVIKEITSKRLQTSETVHNCNCMFIKSLLTILYSNGKKLSRFFYVLMAGSYSTILFDLQYIQRYLHRRLFGIHPQSTQQNNSCSRYWIARCWNLQWVLQIMLLHYARLPQKVMIEFQPRYRRFLLRTWPQDGRWKKLMRLFWKDNFSPWQRNGRYCLFTREF